MIAIADLVVWGVGSMLVLGLLFGVGLMLAARLLSGEENPMVEEVYKLLPKINCGACGYKGCRQYAEAVAQGEAVNKCVPGGADCARALGELMGVEVQETVKLRAVVRCQGGTPHCDSNRFDYVGEQYCRAANITGGGPKDCAYGCLGFGDCAAICPVDAITMGEDRLPRVDGDVCIACGRCVKTCPRSLITLLPATYKIYLGCSSHDRAKAVKDVCDVGCIACQLCVKKDPHGAIRMENDLPVLDFEKAEGDFRVAAEVCPASSYVVEGALPEAVLAAHADEETRTEGG
jgi:electron transport complex protein RnfB